MVGSNGYWNRITQIIEWLDTTPNRFSIQIGMLRAENLYHIKNGAFGISTEFANRVVGHLPEINRTWLLTGVGNMLVAEVNSGTNIPFYDEDVIDILPKIEQMKPSGFASLPFAERCDFIARTSLKTTTRNQPVRLFLRYEDALHIESEREYVFYTFGGVIWCKVVSVNASSLSITLVKSGQHTDIELTDIRQSWLVVARMEID